MPGATLPAAVVTEAVAAARDYLRLADGVEAALLARLAAAAVETAEAYCGEVLIARDFTATVPPSPGWRRLPARPVTAIVAPADGWAVDIDAAGDGWVRVPGGGSAPVTVGFTAGAAATFAALPPPIAQGIAMLTAHLFEARDRAGPPPAAVAALWRPFRRLRLLEPAR